MDTVNHRVFLPWITPVSPQYIGHDAYNMSAPSSPVFLFSDSTAFGSGDVGTSAYSYTNNVLFTNQFATMMAFDVSSNHGFLTSFSGTDVANATVSIDVKSDVFYNARRGGIEVLRYTPPAGTCNAPTGMTTSNITSSSATFSWTAASGAASYNVRYRVVGNYSWTTSTSSTTSFNATGLSPNTNYEWQVQTVCSGGSSSFSSSTTFTTSGTSGCNTPAGLNAGNITNSSAVLSWTAVSGALSYNLQWKKAYSSSWTTVSGLTTNSYNLTGLSSRTDYQFRVQAICSSGSGAYSSPASFKTSGSYSYRLSYIESSNTISNTIDFKLYQNPAGDNLTFEFTGVSNGNVKVNVYDLLGKKVMAIVNPSVKGLNIFKLNTSKLGTGFYIFEIENNGQRQHRKFLISR